VATQIVRPAGAGSETAWVLAACALVVALSAVFVSTHTHSASVQTVAEYQIDARRDLTPAEQGLYADLRIAADELDDSALPSVEDLAGLGIAPFVADMSQARRGEHDWQKLTRGEQVGYLGISHAPDVAGDLLLIVDDHGQAAYETSEPNVWLHRGTLAMPPAQLDPDSLTRDGWRQIVAQFDAGVTRERRTHQPSQEA